MSEERKAKRRVEGDIRGLVIVIGGLLRHSWIASLQPSFAISSFAPPPYLLRKVLNNGGFSASGFPAQ